MWEKFKDNIAALVAVAVFAWIAGNVQGTSTTNQIEVKLDKAIALIDDIRKREERHDTFMNCAKTRLALIEAGVKKPAECGQGE